jgi:hypothetical protein
MGYAQRRPYVVPAALSDLVGPSSGKVGVPRHLAWTGRREYTLDDAADVAVFYERVIVEAATVDDLTALLSAALLRERWRELFLPGTVRALWQARFPELVAAA